MYEKMTGENGKWIDKGDHDGCTDEIRQEAEVNEKLRVVQI